MIKVILLTSFVFSLLFANSQSFNVLFEEENAVAVNHQLEMKPFNRIEINSKMYLEFSKMYEITTLDRGAPQVPRMSTSIKIPFKGQPQLEVTFDAYTDIPNVDVAPSKGNLKRNINPNSIPHFFGDVYEVEAFYPGKLAQVSTPFIARDIRAVTVTVFPYQYNPVTKTLRIYENLKVLVKTDQTISGANEIESSNSNLDSKKVYNSLFLNGNGIEKSIPKEEIGDLLIICPAEMDSVMRILANWKIQKGINTKIVHTAETGMGVNNIKNYISNYYNTNPDFLYLILAGDHQAIPAYTYGEADGEQLWSDSYYGQLAGSDFYPELFVGRFSGNLQAISTMVQRTIEYEKNPFAGNWMQRAVGVGSAEGTGLGLNGLADWEHLRVLRNDLLSASYVEVHEFYDGSQAGNDAVGDPTNTMLSDAINAGVGVLNYTGHGDLNALFTSSFSSTQVSDLNNSGKYPWVISVACNNGAFPQGTCISESWLNASKNGSPTGALAACGSTILMAWEQPMKTQREIVNYLANTNSSDTKTSLGGMFYNAQLKMLEQYPGIAGEQVMQTWVFFGDPTVQIRNRQTDILQASHVSQVEENESELTVFCTAENALISVSQETTLLGTGLILGGSTTISIPTLNSNQPLMVTATKQNHKPYQGAIQVGAEPLHTPMLLESKISIAPNPASTLIRVKFSASSESTLQLLNSTGQLIKSISIPRGECDEFIKVSDLAKGIYQVVISNSGNYWVEKLVVN